MAEESPEKTATPAGNAGVDVAAITKAAVDAATAAVTAAIKPIADQVRDLSEGMGQVPTAESITQAVTAQITAQNASQAKSADRVKFIAEKMKDVPEAYHTLLGDDPAKFAEREQAIRTQLKADLTKLGVKAPDVGGAPGSGGKVTDAIDTSKLSGVELISLGVQQTTGKAVTAPAPESAPAK